MLVLPEEDGVPDDPVLEPLLIESVDDEEDEDEDEEDFPELLDALCVGFVVVVALRVDGLDVVPEDPVALVVAVVVEVVEDDVVDEVCWWGFLWWCFTVVLVSVSDFGGLAAVVTGPSTWECAAG